VHARPLFAPAIFLASALLFLSEPIAARQLLPIFGGSAAVWMTCLVFFQIALLLGYLYAHAVARATRPALHLLPLALAAAAAIAWACGVLHPAFTSGSPLASILFSLGITIGIPFVVLASTSPLLQVWYFRNQSEAGSNSMPFGLFALSNLASFLALFAYPSLIEPRLSLSLQRTLWAGGVCLFTLVTAVIALQSKPTPATPPQDKTEPSATPRAKLLWFLLPMAASMQLSAVTSHLTSNIAAIPLLWILPLAVYLLSFMLAFKLPGIRNLRGLLLRFLAVLLASLGLLLSRTDVDLPIGLGVAFFLLEAFAACLFLHAEAYALRPQRPSETTLFYLILAAGGATGAFLIGIAFPLVFNGNYDLPITFLLTALLALVVVWQTGWQQRLLWATGSGLLLFLVFAIHTAYLHQTIYATRNFYGSLRVMQSVTEHGDPIRTLMNGSIQHGNQIFTPDLSHVPSAYYAHDSGAGLALLHCCTGRTKRVGIIGLGVGTLAAYGKPGDDFRFYEINPADLPIAQNLFTWERDSKAHLSFAVGDARASLSAEPDQHFDVLIVDAFSGDAIPLHLLTVEAMALYRRHLAPGGTLAFHVSNQYVNLEPEIAALAAAEGLEARRIASHEDRQSGEFNATWVLVPTNPALFAEPDIAARATTIHPDPNIKPWTDDYSALLPLVHW
jgi:hypothetical protein